MSDARSMAEAQPPRVIVARFAHSNRCLYR